MFRYLGTVKKLGSSIRVVYKADLGEFECGVTVLDKQVFVFQKLAEHAYSTTLPLLANYLSSQFLELKPLVLKVTPTQWISLTVPD